jgi:hypothetical protein
MNNSVMPVRIEKVEFQNGQRKNPKTIEALKTSEPVWIVIHGRRDQGDADKILDLTKSLVDAGKQVAVIDWREAARDVILGKTSKDVGDLADADWTPEVGQWAAERFLQLGFKADDIRIVAHSHGTYVGYYFGQRIEEKTHQEINLIVALDPAYNPPIINNNAIYTPNIHFSAISKHSWSFLSSEYGSEMLANQAEYYIEVQSQKRHEFTLFGSDTSEAHSYAVTLFADLVRKKNSIDPRLSIDSMTIDMNREGMPLITREEGRMQIDVIADPSFQYPRAYFRSFQDNMGYREGMSSGYNT